MNELFPRALIVCLACFVSCWILGCGMQPDARMDYAETEEFAVSDEPAAADVDAAAVAGELAAGNLAIADRKIIYQSDFHLVVEDYRAFESQLPKLVTNHDGFISSSDTDRRYQSQQSGTWVVRVPVDQYSAFLSGINALGFVESRSETAQDVTEEYIDVEARIKNKRQLETRILTMLEVRTGKLSDVLEIERELSRVREEIERMEGRIRFLTDRTSLATVTIHCREQRSYEPPAAPTLVSRIRQSWSGSLESLRITGESILVASIAILPWLAVLGIPSLLIWRWIKRRFAKRSDEIAKT